MGFGLEYVEYLITTQPIIEVPSKGGERTSNIHKGEKILPHNLNSKSILDEIILKLIKSSYFKFDWFGLVTFRRPELFQ